MTEFPQPTDRLHPAETLLDELPFALTDRIPGMPGRPTIDRAASPARRRVLGHMGRRIHPAQLVHHDAGVVVLVTGDGNGMPPGTAWTMTKAASRSPWPVAGVTNV